MEQSATKLQQMSQQEIETKAAILTEKEQAAYKIIAEVPTVIETGEHYTFALQYLKMIKDRMVEVEEFRVSLTKPLNTALKSLNNRFKKISVPLELARTELDKRCAKFRYEDAEKTREAQEQENARMVEAILKAVDEGKDVTEVTSPEVIKSVTELTPDVGIGFQKVWRYWMDCDSTINSEMDKWPRIIRENSVMLEIPDKYWILDFAAVGKDIRAGLQVPGFSAKQEEVSKNI